MLRFLSFSYGTHENTKNEKIFLNIYCEMQSDVYFALVLLKEPTNVA